MGEERTESKRPTWYERLSVPGAAVTQHRRWASIDALRAIAALMVLASHAPALGPANPIGLSKESTRLGIGVWIFFAASGYLIAGPFLRALIEGRDLPPAGRYAIRRAIRILPAYWVALGAILVLATGSAVTHWWQLPVHVFLIHGLVPGELKHLYLVAWSLGVEAIFYVLVPLGAVAVRRRMGAGPIPLGQMVGGVIVLWCVAVGLSLASAVAFPMHPGRDLPGAVQVFNLVGSLANFCPGMLVFLALAARKDEPSRWRARYEAVASRPIPTLAIAVALFAVATELPFQTNQLAVAVQGPLLGIASGLVLATFVHGEWTRPLARVLAPIGLISYGVYLWHWVILSALGHHHVTILGGSPGIAGAIGRLVILTAMTLPVALISWLVLERPLLRRTTGWERAGGARAVARQRRAEQSDARPLPSAVSAPGRP
jgi:peptidoglycan/LPS O-acetylase OafA/YrhL